MSVVFSLRTVSALPPAPELAGLQVMEPSIGWQPFDDPAWSFALACGGHRLLVQLDHGRVALRSRQHVDVTGRFADLVAALSRWRGGRAVLDGELCVLGDHGLPSPSLLHRRAVGLGETGGRLVLRAFDLLVLEGADVRGWPWHERQRALALLPLDRLGMVERQPQIRGQGYWLHDQAQALGLPGVVARHRDSAYGTADGHPWRLLACGAVRSTPPPG
ncbi:hypothetical protein [Aquabacterium sp. J223]|uniref:ATP-dependent DNA ligase n=1 Tax=Aquabacterium sp. J223 TaxID=2898431 RepID=UPI0021AD75BB|nr:hypothetical protein [Aquabacterium sp. J223]UUX95050.1 hypothetical protein LRS07_17660 [Aquabacterium sp. J223]